MGRTFNTEQKQQREELRLLRILEKCSAELAWPWENPVLHTLMERGLVERKRDYKGNVGRGRIDTITEIAITDAGRTRLAELEGR